MSLEPQNVTTECKTVHSSYVERWLQSNLLRNFQYSDKNVCDELDYPSIGTYNLTE